MKASLYVSILLLPPLFYLDIELLYTLIKDLPNGYQIGQRTYGATCPLSDLSGIEHTGTFGDYLGDHYVYLPTYLILFGEERILYEGVGVSPNETVPFDAKLFEEQHEDNQLNAAIEYIHKN